LEKPGFGWFLEGFKILCGLLLQISKSAQYYVKARQARKNVEVCGAGILILLSFQSIRYYQLVSWPASAVSFPSNQGAVGFFKIQFR